MLEALTFILVITFSGSSKKMAIIPHGYLDTEDD